MWGGCDDGTKKVVRTRKGREKKSSGAVAKWLNCEKRKTRADVNKRKQNVARKVTLNC